MERDLTIENSMLSDRVLGFSIGIGPLFITDFRQFQGSVVSI